MNTLVAASLFDNPWVLVAVVLVGALSQWLMKRRQGNQAENQPSGDDPVPPSKTPERLQRPLDFQEVLRQLLGGEAPPRAPQPPPIPPVMRDAQPAEVWSGEEQVQAEREWMDETEGTHEAARPPANRTARPARPHPALARASATRLEASDRERAAQRFEQLNEQGRHPATVVNTGRHRCSNAGTRAVALLRDSRTARLAFVASLVFGPPKAFES
jgi:type IV secretory pathway VirB10-like protein